MGPSKEGRASEKNDKIIEMIDEVELDEDEQADMLRE